MLRGFCQHLEFSDIKKLKLFLFIRLLKATLSLANEMPIDRLALLKFTILQIHAYIKKSVNCVDGQIQGFLQQIES